MFEPNAYEANKALFEELDRETKAASAALAADDMDAWATHAGRGAELYEEIARALGWRIEAPRHTERAEHAPGANAEDCPACAGRRDLPYPFICPGTGPAAADDSPGPEPALDRPEEGT